MQNKTFDEQVMSGLVIERFLIGNIIRWCASALVAALQPISARESMHAVPKLSGVGEYGWL